MRISKKKEAGTVATVPMNSGKNSISGDAEVGSPANGSAALPEDNTTALVILPAIQSIVAADFFKPDGSRAVLDKLKTEVRKQAEALDISTERGRQAVASLAYKVARSKTALDEQGKKLVSDTKAAIKAIDEERGKVWDEMEDLQKEVRQPLDDYERIEKERVAAHEAAVNQIAAEELRAFLCKDEACIETKIRIIEEIYNGRDWQEFAKRASSARGAALEQLSTRLAAIKREAAEKAEAERLRAEEAERIAKEREEAAARLAREQEQRRAEESARLAREAAEQKERQLEQERIEADARAAEAEAKRVAAEAKAAQDLLDAEKRRRQELLDAEDRRQREAKEAEERAERERQATVIREREASEKAERDRVAAIEAERKRVADLEAQEAADQAKREQNKKHRAKIHAEIENALLFCLDGRFEGLILHVSIEYWFAQAGISMDRPS